MDGVVDELLIAAASQLKGYRRRMFLATVCGKLCDESPRKTEARFGWGRETVAKGLRELMENKPAPRTTEAGRRGFLSASIAFQNHQKTARLVKTLWAQAVTEAMAFQSRPIFTNSRGSDSEMAIWCSLV